MIVLYFMLLWGFLTAGTQHAATDEMTTAQNTGSPCRRRDLVGADRCEATGAVGRIYSSIYIQYIYTH